MEECCSFVKNLLTAVDLWIPFRQKLPTITKVKLLCLISVVRTMYLDTLWTLISRPRRIMMGTSAFISGMNGAIGSRWEWWKAALGVGISSLLPGMLLHSNKLGREMITFPSIDLIWYPDAFQPMISVTPNKFSGYMEKLGHFLWRHQRTQSELMTCCSGWFSAMSFHFC